MVRNIPVLYTVHGVPVICPSPICTVPTRLYLSYFFLNFRCIEKGREKCDHYWPFDTEPVYYGDIQVLKIVLNVCKNKSWELSKN
jgi:hypothetical protein